MIYKTEILSYNVSFNFKIKVNKLHSLIRTPLDTNDWVSYKFFEYYCLWTIAQEDSSKI